MEKLLTIVVLVSFIACTEMETPIYQEANPEVTFKARSQKAKKGNYRGQLTGDQTLATGQVYLQFADDNASVYYKLLVANIGEVTGAYLYHNHLGDIHAVFPLFEGFISGDVNGILAESTLTDADITCSCDDPGHHSLAHLRTHIEDGEIIVKVHTEEYANGEIEGLIY